jgi:hypothetical protein
LEERRQRVFCVNRDRVLNAQLLFAYIESADCYGTLVEIGIASAASMPIGIGFAPNLPLDHRDELWMAAQAARVVCHGTPRDCWTDFSR